MVFMGILDNYIAGFKDELQRVSDGIDKVQAGAQSVVEAIDTVEEKVNNLPSEEELAAALKQKVQSTKNSDPEK